MFEHRAVLWILLALPIAITPGIAAMRANMKALGVASILIRAACLTILVAAAAGLRVSVNKPARGVAIVAAIDESRSISANQADWMRGRVHDIARSMSRDDLLGVIGFGRDVAMLSGVGDPRAVGSIGGGADRSATDIAGAMVAAQSLLPTDADRRIVLLSDGNETSESAMAEAAAATEGGVRVFTAAPPAAAARRVALVEFAAPSAVRQHQEFNFRVAVQSESAVPADAQLKLYRDGAAIGAHKIALKRGMNEFEIPYRMETPGAYLMSAEIQVPVPQVLLNARGDAALDVRGAPRVLVVSAAAPESIIAALKARSYDVDLVSPRALGTHAEQYLGYQLIILSDASAAALTPAVQHALSRYVADYGGGLVVTGEMLRDIGYRGGELEKVLPVNFAPQPPPPTREPIAVYLCIDRSNSMSYDSRYPAVRDGERIRYAKQAAIALLRQLDDTDLAGVIAFDSQPYILGHLTPLAQNRAELENRIERLQPGGGTDFKQALEIAQHEILASKVAVRQVLLLTDGDTNRQYHDHDDLIADFASQKIPVSTIRIGPDLENLRLLQDFAAATGGVFYRVEDIEKLPLLLVGLTREAMNRRKQGRTAVDLVAPSAIISGISLAEIPPIDFFAASTAKESAQVTLRASRGGTSAPLLAQWQYGLGRAVVFSAEPDSLATLSWIRWNRYAQFWSQLAQWTMRTGEAGAFSIAVSRDAAGSVSIEAENAEGSAAPGLLCRIEGGGKTTDVPMTQIDATLYRADAGRLPRGKYTASLVIKSRDTDRIIAHRAFATTGAPDPDAAELRIRPPNYDLLIRIANSTHGAFDAPVGEITRHEPRLVAARESAAPILIPIAIILFLGEVFVRKRLMGD
jgi:uncharacterized membrane protein